MQVGGRARASISVDRGKTGATGEEIESDESSLGRELADIGYCLVLGEVWEFLRDRLRPAPAKETPAAVAEDDWEPAPSAIPFGPFLVIGFLATVFIGEWLTQLYLHFAFKPPMPPY